MVIREVVRTDGLRTLLVIFAVIMLTVAPLAPRDNRMKTAQRLRLAEVCHHGTCSELL